MSKKTFIHAENNNKILSSNEVKLYVPPEPEKMKIIIWGKELCNGAEWYDFLKCVEEKTRENDQLKQQLEEYKNKENTSAVNSWDEMLKNCENCGLNECIGCEYTQTCVQNIKQQLAEKQNTIDEINKEFVQAVHDWKALCAEKDTENEKLKQQYTILENENGKLTTELIMDKYKKAQKEVSFGKQLAIQELEKVKTLIQNAINFEKPNFVEVYDAINKQINDLRGEKDE